MNNYFSIRLLLLISLFLIISCASVKRPDGTNGILQGMIYDYENKPVCGFHVSIDGKQKTVTDINGRFTIPDVLFGTHAIEGNGTEYSPWSENIDFNDKTQVLYIRVPSTLWLFAKLDGDLTESDFKEAKKTLSQFSASETQSPRYTLYSNIFLFRTSTTDNKDFYFNESLRISTELNK